MCIMQFKSPYQPPLLKTSCCVWGAVSHGHLDHVGAVDQLLAAYPDLKVCMFCLGPKNFLIDL